MSQEPLELVKAHWAKKKPASPIYAMFLDKIELVSATSGSIHARLLVEEIHLNSANTLHGAVSATITDWAGTMAVASTGAEKSGVSTDIHVSYVSSAKAGETIDIHCTASKVGSTMAYTTLEIKRASDGKVVATGSHTKFVR
jgi:acyl-coenzyme A thioesterase 13